MAQMTQTEAKYLLFDAMLAVQELSWASRLPSVVVEMISVDRDLTEFYNSLDKFKDLVYTSSVNKNTQELAIQAFNKEIAPQLKVIEDRLKTHKHRFRNYSVAQRQLGDLWKFKE
jgi:hypothetical protein